MEIKSDAHCTSKESVRFSQDALYAFKNDTILKYLTQETLSNEDSINFRNILFSYIDDQINFNKCILPPFGKDCEWLNTTRPLCSVKDLGRKIYVIDFFTYCCINCVHVLPYLTEIETKFANKPEFAVIGVHSPKFPNEKDLENTKKALVRNNIKHPVLHDPSCTLWDKFGIFCWPTVFIVGPNNILLFVLIGEIQIAKLSFLCEYLLGYQFLSPLDVRPLPISEIKEFGLNKNDLLFPGNISSNKSMLIVSDTGHNRLLLMSRYLEVKEIIGSGDMGCNDGPFNAASFNSPHGTAWYKDYIYVADTGNHSIRKIDFKEKIVSTVFSDKVDIIPDSHYYSAKFRSPWDVCVAPKIGGVSMEVKSLYIAVAGSHQIWQLHLEDDLESPNFCLPFAGSGKEENRQNNYCYKAGFAQPSGITYSHLIPEYIFVADSESSTIKSVCISLKNTELCLPKFKLEKLGCVKTIVGGGLDPTDLFQFGDHDGHSRQAKLQHPMSVCVADKNTLIVADTYNHKIKFVKVENGECNTVKTIAGLNEPSGICILDETLFIADTNNHRIITYPVNEIVLQTALQDIPDFVMCSHNVSPHDPPETVITIASDGHIFCYFKVISSKKYILNDGPQKMDISFEGKSLDADYSFAKIYGPELKVTLKPFPGLDQPQSSQVNFTFTIPVCEKDLKVCCFKKVHFKVTVRSQCTDAARSVCLNLELLDEHKIV